MQPDVAMSLVGKPVKDIYGRQMGYAVGFSIGTSGEVASVGVDEGSGRFIEYPADRMISDKEGFIVVPTWKLEGMAITREIDMINKRIQSLNDLLNSGEVDQHLYQKNLQAYQQRLNKIRDSCKSFAARIDMRLRELDAQADSVDGFLLNLKVYYKSGEMDEATYRAQSEYSNSMKARDAREREELTSILTLLSATFSSLRDEPVIPEEEVEQVKIHANLGA